MPIDLNPSDPDYATDAQKRGIQDGLQRSLPAVITTSSVLVRDTHANLPVRVNSVSAVNIDMPATASENDEFEVYNLGAGAVTLRTNAGSPLTSNAALPATIDQYSVGLVKFMGGAFIRWA